MAKNVISYLDYLYEKDYKERPVDIETFICDNKFLGQSTNGGKAIYDIWKTELGTILNEDSRTLIVLTGAIGTGKTTAAYIGMAYTLHKLLCLKNAWRFFDLSDANKMAVTFFNLTKDLGKSRGFGLLQSFMFKSPWFIDKSSSVTGKVFPIVNFPLFEYVLASPYSKGFGTVGLNVITAVMDEVDDPNESVKQKQRVLKAYDATARRFESRFVINGESLGRFWLVASKQEELSFLNVFIKQMKGSNRVYVVDIAIWDAKPSTNYCGKKFAVKIGDAYTPPKILTDKEAVQASSEGATIKWIPIEYRDDFERDIVGALRDIAGVSVDASRKGKLFNSEKLLLQCYDETKVSPISTNVINTGLKDQKDYITYFDLTKLRSPLNVPRYIHEDIAFSGDGDCVGLGCSHVKEWRKVPIQKADGSFTEKRVKVVETDFTIRFKAPPGDQVPAFKVRKLILDLRSRGLNIKKFTADLVLASTDTAQILGDAGITCEYLSLDRTPQAYLEFRNVVLENRWISGLNAYLHIELKNLEYDEKEGKVDHPDKFVEIEVAKDGDVQELVMDGSKDMADGTVGSVVSALWEGVTPPNVKEMEKILGKVAPSPGKMDTMQKLMNDLTGIALAKEIPTVNKERVISDDKKRFQGMLKKLGRPSRF
jgi:hypothetical protein